MSNHPHAATARSNIANDNGISSTRLNENTPAEDSGSSTDGDSSDTDSDYTPTGGTVTLRPGQNTGNTGNTGTVDFFTPAEGTVTFSHDTSTTGRDDTIFTPPESSVSYGESNDFLRIHSKSINYGANYVNSVDPAYVHSYQGHPMEFYPTLNGAQNQALPYPYLNNPVAMMNYNYGSGIQGGFLQTPSGYLGRNVVNNPAAFQGPASGYYGASAMYNNLIAFQGPVNGYYSASAIQNNLTPVQGPIGGYYDASVMHNYLQYQSLVSQPVAQAPALRSKNKYASQACPLCPGKKLFKTEKSLQMHMESEVHTPTASRPGVNKKGKGKGKKQNAPGGFGPADRYYAGPIADSTSEGAVDFLNEGLSGMGLTDGPQAGNGAQASGGVGV